MMPQRHHLIYLKPDADFVLLSCHEDKPLIKDQVFAWLANGLPCIYAKQIPGDECISLGLPLYFAQQKHRVALRVAAAAVQQQTPPPQLTDMQDFFLRAYGVDGLRPLIDDSGITDIAVYGSFLTHYLSGSACVTPDSDLDLLIPYQQFTLNQLQDLVAVLTHQFKRLIDGEIRFPGLGDVSLKELLDCRTAQILCKRKDNVLLLSRTKLYEHYPLL